MDTTIALKRAVGKRAADLIEDGMHVGLGTGSTAACFIESLAERCKQGLKITAVATSDRSTELARKLGITILPFDTITELDIDVDGADEIDPQKRLLKGGGGALLREKIIATNSKEMIVIVDENKLVPHLGKFGLPVEIVPFLYRATLKKIEELGYQGALRKTAEGKLYLTDNSHYIFDVHFSPVSKDPERDHATLRSVTGVVDTGFFFGIAGRVIVGYNDGRTEIYRDLIHVI